MARRPPRRSGNRAWWPRLSSEFPGADTNHYITSQAAVIDSGDAEDLVRLVRSKGFGASGSGQTLLLLCNPVESETVQTWRSGKESRSGGPVAKFDWVPAVSAPRTTPQMCLSDTPFRAILAVS
jgi:hypothetical protein